jgi:hypothetical protein
VIGYYHRTSQSSIDRILTTADHHMCFISSGYSSLTPGEHYRCCSEPPMPEASVFLDKTQISEIFVCVRLDFCLVNNFAKRKWPEAEFDATTFRLEG